MPGIMEGGGGGSTIDLTKIEKSLEKIADAQSLDEKSIFVDVAKTLYVNTNFESLQMSAPQIASLCIERAMIFTNLIKEKLK